RCARLEHGKAPGLSIMRGRRMDRGIEHLKDQIVWNWRRRIASHRATLAQHIADIRPGRRAKEIDLLRPHEIRRAALARSMVETAHEHDRMPLVCLAHEQR